MSRHPRFGFLAVIPALLLALPLCSFALPRQMEALDRGLLVSNVGKAGMLVSWRLLGTESSDTEFNLYRDTVKIATIGKTAGTNFLDKDGKPTSKYSVAAVVGGKEGAKNTASVVLDSTVAFDGKSFPYKVLKLDVPVCKTLVTGDTCSYTPNDMSTADLDGDGQYELVVKWDPSNSKDNSQMGKNAYTGPVFIDAYKIDGTKMWRVNLGKNIRAGAHYTQFQVYDYDGDGKAEMIVKTGDGTIDGKGKVIGDSSKDYHNDSAMIITGPEYLTVFNGLDGAEITTIDYVPSRDIRKFGPADSTGGTTWGDKYGNRCDRFLAATAYLDGIHPSAIFARGYYTAAYVVAYDFDGKELKQRWFHKSETPGQGLYGQGNHNIAVGDLDGDGFDEIVYGAAALDHDGTVLYSTGYGHGDAGHLTDIDPDHPGLEFWSVHENVNQAPYTDELRGADGKVIWGTMQGGRDNGRALAADIDSTYRGLELWSSKGGALRSAKGEYIDKPEYYIRDTTDVIYDTVKLADTTMYFTHYIYDEEAFGYPINFRIYFDGDLQDELLDGPVVYKPNVPNQSMPSYFDGATALGLAACNGTKNTPNLVADLFGDWREELILRSENDPSKVYILSTPVTTPYRLYTLMHDSHYRVSVAWQNTAYNLPPHTSYYLPDMAKKLAKPTVYTVGKGDFVVAPDAVIISTSSIVNQTVNVYNEIKDISYRFMFCTGVKVEGLPEGVSAKVDTVAKTVKISGKPSKTGKFSFTLTTTGSKGNNVTAKGEISVVRASLGVGGISVVDAAYPTKGNGATKQLNGYTGKGLFDFDNSKSSSATWTISSPVDSTVTMSIRFANGSDAARDMVLLVNDKEVGTVFMDVTGGWDKWGVFDIKVSLKKGKNTLTLKSTKDVGGPDLDAFYFNIAGVETYTESSKDALPVVNLDRGFFYSPAKGTLFTSVPGFVEILFYDVSGHVRASISRNVTAGESVLALEHGVLPAGMYLVKVKMNGLLKQKGMFNIKN